MSKKEKTLDLLLQQKMLPLYYNDNSQHSISILQVLYDAGIRVVEFTNRGENAAEIFRALRKHADKNMQDLVLGIGTIKTKKEAKQFIDLGSEFIVAPTINEEVGEMATKNKLLWIPGCMTPTEIARAENAGAKIVKIFPANVTGPSYIKALLEIFPRLLFMPSGGVEVEKVKLKTWFDAGACAVAIGSKLIPLNVNSLMHFDKLKTEVRETMILIKQLS